MSAAAPLTGITTPAAASAWRTWKSFGPSRLWRTGIHQARGDVASRHRDLAATFRIRAGANGHAAWNAELRSDADARDHATAHNRNAAVSDGRRRCAATGRPHAGPATRAGAEYTDEPQRPCARRTGCRICRCGGSPLATEAAAGAAASGALPPGQANYMQNLTSAPVEKLQELAARIPPNTPQGQMIQRVISMKRMSPNTEGIQGASQAQAQPLAPNAFSPTAGFGNGQGGLGLTTQPFARSGGRISGFAAGGAPAASGSMLPGSPCRPRCRRSRLPAV